METLGRTRQQTLAGRKKEKDRIQTASISNTTATNYIPNNLVREEAKISAPTQIDNLEPTTGTSSSFKMKGDNKRNKRSVNSHKLHLEKTYNVTDLFTSNSDSEMGEVENTDANKNDQKNLTNLKQSRMESLGKRQIISAHKGNSRSSETESAKSLNKRAINATRKYNLAIDKNDRKRRYKHRTYRRILENIKQAAMRELSPPKTRKNPREFQNSPKTKVKVGPLINSKLHSFLIRHPSVPCPLKLTTATIGMKWNVISKPFCDYIKECREKKQDPRATTKYYFLIHRTVTRALQWKFISLEEIDKTWYRLDSLSKDYKVAKRARNIIKAINDKNKGPPVAPASLIVRNGEILYSMLVSRLEDNVKFLILERNNNGQKLRRNNLEIRAEFFNTWYHVVPEGESKFMDYFWRALLYRKPEYYQESEIEEKINFMKTMIFQKINQ